MTEAMQNGGILGTGESSGLVNQDAC